MQFSRQVKSPVELALGRSAAQPEQVSVNTPHDRLFLYAFENLEVACEELQAVLPTAIWGQLEWPTMQVEPTRFVEEDLSARHCDILYRVDVQGGGDAFIWILLEHQSRNDPLMGLRLLEYMVRVWSKLRRNRGLPKGKLPMILPVVIGQGPGLWASPTSFRSLYAGPEPLVAALQPLIPDFTYILDDLTTHDELSLSARSESPFLRLVLWSLRSRGTVNPAVKHSWVTAFRALWRAGKQEAALAIVRYHVEVSEEPVPVALEAAAEADPDLERSCMTLYERLQKQGEAETLLRQITLKFGTPGPEILRRVHNASKAELDVWVERILTVSSVEALFA